MARAPIVQATQAEPDPVPIAEPEIVPIGEEVTEQVRDVVSSRARSAKKSRVREPPTTGVGTMHNPRVRKADGVKTRSTTVHLPIELAKKLAVHCAMSGRKQSDVIADVLDNLLA